MQTSRFLLLALLSLFAVISVTNGISCSNPGRYAGQSLCDHQKRYCGQCVSFVKICTGDRRKTEQWTRGIRVRGADIPIGTAIATFPNGAYQGHAAIYIGQDKQGIQVWDQFSGTPVSRRTIRWNGARVSNNGDSFYVID